MKILIACEYSGIVRGAFAAKGHDAWSCDLLPTEQLGQHIQGDVLEILDDGWDLMIAHPPCTYLAVSGARWFKYRRKEQEDALEFVRKLMDAPIEMIAIENPISVISTKIRKPDQIIQPWMFGHFESKATCLWLKGLPHLAPTNIVEPDYMRNPDGSVYRDAKGSRYSKIHYLSRWKKDRGKLRSRTYGGIAEAMSAQWNFD